MSDAEVDVAQVAADIEALDASQTTLDAHLGRLDDVDPSTPTVLPGWSIGHVMTHIARNADSTLRMLSGLPQYWKGAESRATDIELGAGRSWAELVDDVWSTNAAVMVRMREVADWTGTIRATTAERPKSMLPVMRRREVEIHHTDLGLGYGFAELPSDYTRAEARRLEMLWQSRQPMGLTSLPASVQALPEDERLAWLCGRRTVEGVEPAGVF